MVPDIEWGKNIRLVLDIGCTDVSFGSALLDKDVLMLSFGLKDDQADLAQVALERGFPAVIGSMATRRLPFPSGVFDAIHCGGCRIPWHSNGLLSVYDFSFPAHFCCTIIYDWNVLIQFMHFSMDFVCFIGGKLILEMNRILRPGGYFILSTEHENIEVEEGVTSVETLTSY